MASINPILINSDFVMGDASSISRGKIYKALEAEGLQSYLDRIPQYNKVQSYTAKQITGRAIISGCVLPAAVIILTSLLAGAACSSGSLTAAFSNSCYVGRFIIYSGISSGLVGIGLIGGVVLVVSTLMKRKYLNQQMDRASVEQLLEMVKQAIREEYAVLTEGCTKRENLLNRFSSSENAIEYEIL